MKLINRDKNLFSKNENRKYFLDPNTLEVSQYGETYYNNMNAYGFPLNAFTSIPSCTIILFAQTQVCPLLRNFAASCILHGFVNDTTKVTVHAWVRIK